MKKQHLFLAAVAITALAGCTDEQFEGQNVASQGGGSLVIKMGTGSPEAITRADKTGKDAAELLNNNFIVEGFKSEGSTTTLENPVEVFRYYNVNYYDGTANSTESNSHGWEYVSQIPVAIGDGKEFITGAGFTPVNNQTIKYWDTDYAQYDFVAFSRGTGAIVTTPSADTTYAQFSAVVPGNIGKAAVAGNEVYTINGTNAEIGTAYVADLVTVEKSEANDNYRKANPVTPRFRKLAAKIRMAIYETVPGYSVKDVRFYTSANETTEPKKTTEEVGSLETTPTLISVEANDVFKTDKADIPSQDGTGKVSVFYPVTGNDNKSAEGYNKAQIKFIPAETGTNLTSTLQFANLVYGAEEAYETSGNIYLGRKSNQATYAGTQTSGETIGTDYIDVVPTGDSHVLKLRVAYTLVPTDGGDEIIVMEDATAVVPAQYAEWQPNYAYTYIFKISEKSGEGLYPITFDALVMDSEDGIQETITEVSDPSITTYQKGKIVTENDEYLTDDSIFVVVDNGKALSKTDDGVGYVRLFNAVLTPVESATAPNAATALQSITEATAENCFEKGTYAPAVTEGTPTPATWTVTDAAGATLVLTDMTDSLTIAETIPALKTTNGLTWTINNAWFEPTAAGYYVFQYETAAAVLYTYEEYKALEGNSEVTAEQFNNLIAAEKTKTPAKYMYKVIKVAEAGSGTDDDSGLKSKAPHNESYTDGTF